ncbi:hypothetical protein NPIL_520921 [Nephila pilipes]|uniref:Uncharacterized protein n=1 Tax=Nephila pilipes TaxID=299642 RepID=A0A8X6PHU2_NEPPI|nr:hypothetical protein NPIL_520921 [Nephila pilipes]
MVMSRVRPRVLFFQPSRVFMAGKNKICTMYNPNDLETIITILLCDSDVGEDIVLDGSDTGEEHVSEREVDSESE